MPPASFTRSRARRPIIPRSLIINYLKINKRNFGEMQPESRQAPVKPRPFLEKFLPGTNLLTATRTLINIKDGDQAGVARSGNSGLQETASRRS